MVKKIAILGSTGTIGQNTLNIIDRFPSRFKVVALTAYNLKTTSPANKGRVF